MFELFQGISQFFISLFASTAMQADINHDGYHSQLPLQHSIPGGVVIVDAGYGFQPPSVRFNEQPVMVVRPDPQQSWKAVVGIPLTQPAGEAEVYIERKARRINIAAHDYQQQHLNVARKHVDLSPENLARVRSEQQKIKQAFARFSRDTGFTPERGFSPLAWPLAGDLSSPFGLQRFFNGQPRKPHSGLDIAAVTGSAILAPADGEVVLTGNFFFNGNSVFIDHGQGLITMYCHMDSLEVSEGEQVVAGDRLGTVGATGRVTGPHLHWTASLNNARVNPLLLLSPLPGVAAPTASTAHAHE